MSGLIFPNYLPGLLFTQKKSPTFNTGVHPAVTGKESRLSYRAYPLYEYELSYEFLRDNADGRTNYAPYSSDVTHWTQNSQGTGFNPFVVANYATAPDGTLTADRVILNRGSGSGGGNYCQAYQGGTAGTVQALVGSTVTASMWLKTNDGSTVTVLLFFDGGVSPPNSGVNCVIGPTWQRFTATGLVRAPYWYCGLRIDSGNAPTSTYADLSVWGAQLELGSSVGPLIPTNGAAVVTGDLKTMFGLFSQMLGQQDTFLYQDPDFNTVTLQQFLTGNGSITSWPLTAQYMPGNDFIPPFGLAGLPELIQTANGSPQIYTLRYGAQELLSTGSRTNLALQSTMGATWTATNGTIAASAATSPDGAAHATQLTDNTTSGAHAITQGTITITGGSRYTFSVWLKYTNHQYVVVLWDNGSNDGVSVNVDLINGTLGPVHITSTAYASNADATITAYPNNWWRVSISGLLPVADTNVRLAVAFAQNANQFQFPLYAGTGTDTFYCWGAQFELGTQATALIVTTTAAATNGGSDYSIGATNIVTPASTLANGVSWAWSGSFYYRNRFGDDRMDFAEFLYQFWELKTLKMQQVKL